MKTGRFVALLGSLTLALPAAVHADGFRSYRVCGGDQFATCAAVNISVVGSNVTVRLWNLSGNAAGTWGHGAGTHAGTVFNGIGFYNTTGASAVLGSLSVNGPAMAGTTPGSWKLTNNSRVNFGVDFRVGSQGSNNMDNGVASGCAPSSAYPSGVDLYSNPCTSVTGNTGDWVTFSFKISGNWDPNNSDIVIRGINGPTGNATECWTGDTPAGIPSNCTVITPEPVSMTLLATGLAGIGGAGALRRRKQKQNAA